jgi:hypothetical protein
VLKIAILDPLTQRRLTLEGERIALRAEPEKTWKSVRASSMVRIS